MVFGMATRKITIVAILDSSCRSTHHAYPEICAGRHEPSKSASGMSCLRSLLIKGALLRPIPIIPATRQPS